MITKEQAESTITETDKNAYDVLEKRVDAALLRCDGEPVHVYVPNDVPSRVIARIVAAYREGGWTVELRREEGDRPCDVLVFS